MSQPFPFDGEWMRCVKAPHPDFEPYVGIAWWVGYPKGSPGFALAYPDHEYSDTRARLKARRLTRYFRAAPSPAPITPERVREPDPS